MYCDDRSSTIPALYASTNAAMSICVPGHLSRAGRVAIESFKGCTMARRTCGCSRWYRCGTADLVSFHWECHAQWIWEHLEEVWHVEEVIAMAIPKPVTAATAAAGPIVDGVWPKKYPTLWGYLQDVVYEDGSGRKTSTITVFIEHGQCKLCLNDRDTGRTAWAAGPTVEAAAKAMEDRLENGSMEWRAAVEGRVKKGRG